MSKKGECIYKRKDEHWEGRHHNGSDKNGKAIYRLMCEKNRDDVRIKRNICKKAGASGVSGQNGTVLFKDAVYMWGKMNLNRNKGATKMKYENLINKHILPELGNYKLSEINSLMLSDFMNNKLNCGRIDCSGGLSPSYVRSIMLIVLKVIDFAVGEEMCSPLKTKLHKPSIEKNELEILDIPSQVRLENRLIMNPNETNLGILISLNMGLRISEVCALKWTDIDLKKAILHVRSTVARVKNNDYDTVTKLIIDKPKTKSSLRDIPIPKRIMKVLISLYENRKSDYVISDKEGFVSPRTYEYRFHRVLDECDLPSVNYHVLRHTFATRCIEFGVDVKTLSEILGHANVSITLNTYVHSSMERKREQLEKLARVSA